MADENAVGIACEYSAEAFASALQRMYVSPELAERLGENARDAALRKLDWEHQIERLKMLYAELTEKRSAALGATVAG